MGFVQRELDRISKALAEASNGDRYTELYAAQQALAWALEPDAFKAPYSTITGTLEERVDCSEHNRPPRS